MEGRILPLLVFLFFIGSVSAANPVSLIRNSTWSSNLIGVFHSSLVLGDLNNDGYSDLITSGCSSGDVDECTTADLIRVYFNNRTLIEENDTFEQNTTNLGYGSLALGDIDNDGDLDLVALGDKGGGNGAVKVYTNNGTAFEEDLVWEDNLNAIDAFAGSLALGDIDNDGDLDLALVGASPSTDNGIYLNNGTALIKEAEWLSILPYVGHGLGMGSLALGDIDNDGDLDLAFAGSYSANFYTAIYINNGTSLESNSSYLGDFTATFGWPSLTLGDIDNDGDLDLVVIGTRTGDHQKFYNNTGSSFSLIQELGAYFDGSIALGDYDNDGDLDLASMGKESERNRIYTNDGAIFGVDIFEQQDMRDDNLQQGSLAWNDLDNDFNLDLTINGKQDDTSNYFSYIYISNASLSQNNTLPEPPTEFTSTYSNGILILTWGNGSDAETNASGLYYNLRIGRNETDNNSIVSGVFGGSSNPTAGYFGNMMQRHSIQLNIALDADTTYNWSVQTIDTGLAKSEWSEIQSFTTSSDVTKPSIVIEEPSPENENHTQDTYFIFNATVTDDNLVNVTFYADFTGTMIANETNESVNNITYTFERNLSDLDDRMYLWYAEACDGSGNCNNTGTRSIYLDREYPLIYLESSDGVTSTSADVTFLFNVSDVDIANCSLIVNGAYNSLLSNVSENTSQGFTISLDNEDYTWNVNCSDYVGFTNTSSIYSLTVDVPPATSSSSGGGGGGTTGDTYVVSNLQAEQGVDKILEKDDKIKIYFSEKQNDYHTVLVNSVGASSVNLTVSSSPINLLISVGEEKKLNLDGDNYYDLIVKLNSINNSKADLSVWKISEEIGGIEDNVNETIEENLSDNNTNKNTDENGVFGNDNVLTKYLFIAVILIIIGFMIIKYWMERMKRKIKMSGRG